ncbi:MAG TPA: 2,3-bisphosphoglycerate-independent phosphoglycerate mutase [Bacteroidia bacterium]|jgi:2,3-bisphosphoglycerate-independent phosphoglycerate mutase|nr:2,3-bisphosphoglycerate-independent phosphoglycerate mutase [Bacteroidia bacterium]
MNRKAILIILDGWGIGDGTKSDAIANSRTPFYRSLLAKYPHTTLRTSGQDVGLPGGQMGNSEVGHLNIGAGRVVYQDLEKINKACRENSIDTEKEILDLFDYVKRTGKKLHFIGLVSDGGVHSSQEHLHHLLSVAKKNDVKNVFVHAFTDGRDTDPKSGKKFIGDLLQHMNSSTGKLASVCGRYYAMDRDKRWERVKIAYDGMVNAIGKKSADALHSIEESYAENVTDEFIKPIIMTNADGSPVAKIEEDDAVFCFNFRTDRCREITTVLTQKDMPEQGMKTIPLYYVTMTIYDHSFQNIKVVYGKDDLVNTMGEMVSKAGRSQIRIAETEKYPHVTFFFSGGREKEFDGERRIMIQSPKVATYDLQPEMSAVPMTDAIVPELEKGSADFICLNYANTDMVGHTGVYSAVVKAAETVDACLQRVVEAGLKSNYSFIIIADHGNADYMINPDGTPNTAHTKNPVPCILIDDHYKKISEGRLADIAPTMLTMMGIEIPKEMDGKVLVG